MEWLLGTILESVGYATCKSFTGTHSNYNIEVISWISRWLQKVNTGLFFFFFLFFSAQSQDKSIHAIIFQKLARSVILVSESVVNESYLSSSERRRVLRSWTRWWMLGWGKWPRRWAEALPGKELQSTATGLMWLVGLDIEEITCMRINRVHWLLIVRWKKV